MFKISWRGIPYIPFRYIFAKFYGKCPKCGHWLVMRKGKYGKFLGCSNYPDCTYTRNLKG